MKNPALNDIEQKLKNVGLNKLCKVKIESLFGCNMIGILAKWIWIKFEWIQIESIVKLVLPRLWAINCLQEKALCQWFEENFISDIG